MTITHSLTVNAPATEVWDLIGPNFADVSRWMAATPRSEPIEGAALPGAPVKGRNSYLIKKFDPMYQEELITAYSDAKRQVSFDVFMRKAPKVMPLKGYGNTVTVEEISAGRCKVTWTATPNIKWFGKLMQGPLVKQLSAGFLRNLEEIQHLSETGQPHPRKVEKMHA